MRLSTYRAALFAAAVISCATGLGAQEPSAQAPAPASSAESSSQQQNHPRAKNPHSDDFLVRGTVFTAEGMALPGAELRIRRISEKKTRWDTISNSRGDFAVRVKMGSDYEVTVRARGYQQQSQAVDAKTGERGKDLVFRMQRAGG